MWFTYFILKSHSNTSIVLYEFFQLYVFMILHGCESSRNNVEWQKMKTKPSCIIGGDILKYGGCLSSDHKQDRSRDWHTQRKRSISLKHHDQIVVCVILFLSPKDCISARAVISIWLPDNTYFKYSCFSVSQLYQNSGFQRSFQVVTQFSTFAPFLSLAFSHVAFLSLPCSFSPHFAPYFITYPDQFNMDVRSPTLYGPDIRPRTSSTERILSNLN